MITTRSTERAIKPLYLVMQMLCMGGMRAHRIKGAVVCITPTPMIHAHSARHIKRIAGANNALFVLS
jgi:hypothetical protein